MAKIRKNKDNRCAKDEKCYNMSCLTFFISGRVAYLQGLCAAQGRLYVLHDAHLGVAVGLDRHGHLLLVGGSHALAFGGHVVGKLVGGYQLVVKLYASGSTGSARGSTYIYIGDGRLLDQAGELGALGYLEAHLDCVLLHVGDYHKEEEHREYQVG